MSFYKSSQVDHPLQALKTMVGANLNETQLQYLVNRTMQFMPEDENGNKKIAFQDFTKLVTNDQFVSRMFVSV